MKRTGGFMIMDLMLALTAVMVVAVALSIALSQTRKAATVLADRRAAVHLAEQALARAQAGQPVASIPGEGVTLRKLDDPQPAPGWVWVQATAHRGGQTASLTGLAPAQGVAP